MQVTLVVPVKKPRITETPFAKIDGSQNDKLPLKLDDVPPGTVMFKTSMY